jgi:hypothetical protein
MAARAQDFRKRIGVFARPGDQEPHGWVFGG